MSKRTVIDYDVDKWKRRLNDNTISLDEVRNTYKMFHTKDLGSKHLDYNIRLAFKTKFKNELANFAGTDKFCYICKTSSSVEIKETFLHACYTCPHVRTLINNVSQDFNMGHNLKAKEVLLYKAYPDRKNSCVDNNRSLAFRCIWMLFYSFIMKCRSSNVVPHKDELYKHITDAINMCTKYHPNSELTIAFRKYGRIK